MSEIHEKLQLIQSKLVAPKGQFNNFGKYKFRSCEDILNALKPLLKETKTTLTLHDDIVLIGERYYVKATAQLHDKEARIEVSAYAREDDSHKGFDSSQLTGSTSSYARKYALNGLFCIDDTKDADSTNKHEEKKEDKKALLYTEVIGKGKATFPTQEIWKEWLKENGFEKPIKEMNEDELSGLLDVLNA